MRVGWIGLGEIGMPMAERLGADHELVVWNRTPERMAGLAAAGAGTAGSAVELAERVEVVLTCIDTPEGLDEVLFGDRGIASAARPPRLVIDHSTMHPAVSCDQANRLAEAGMAFVDAPVSGGPRGARAGTLALFVGGMTADVEVVRQVASSYAGRITHLGPLGSGQVGKLCNQVVNFATMAAIAEATALGAAFGLDDALLPEAMSGGLADSHMLQEYARGRSAGESTNITGIITGLRGMLLGDDDTLSGGRVDILLKDLGAALEVAREVGSPAPLSGLLDGLYRMLLNEQPTRPQ
ncbi:3-hydroxyisobutyrate dehydrogenase-like beta-hydroxyacid dehydrogenase [Nocardioides sp. BE266]|uniref:NAD(P)-dependent oxidoreductase n=1 Tax=Nocardioides sp. BE266 TaxID=2817725 RepID=UPI002857402B|nr:NAD(P)-dependent oxidoreductase [Nocardioides sp. BE266]MDR7254274.1 3-hydroxyisobutyrate dehydrogenase-like beta-hydroxyacid dehydrogenase [Nocardioides sp. BE266]